MRGGDQSNCVPVSCRGSVRNTTGVVAVVAELGQIATILMSRSRHDGAQSQLQCA
jgi:hypothetical protein